jgi:flagellar motor switch protein FliM
VVNSFHIEMDGGGGDLHVTFPYSMIEPIREQLDAGLQSDVSEVDDRWVKALRSEVLNCKVDLNCKIAEREIPLRDLVNLQPGDVIPFDMNDSHILTANNVPMFRAELGKTGDNLALKVLNAIRLK